MSRSLPRAEPHGSLRELFDGIHVVQGSMTFFGVCRFSRVMTVVERGEGTLVIIEAVRLNADGLAALDALGRVTDVIRIAAGHGRDVPFYKQRYRATVWDIEGQRFFRGSR